MRSGRRGSDLGLIFGLYLLSEKFAPRGRFRYDKPVAGMEVMMNHDISYRRAYTHSWQNFSDRGEYEKTIPKITEKKLEAA